MKNILGPTKAKNNEEYREELKTQNLVLGIVMVCGLAVTGVTLWAQIRGISQLSDYIMGVYCGTGIGLTLGCLIKIIKNVRRMKDEEKLKKSRLENSDERLCEIRGRAQRIAMFILLLTIFAGGLIGGIFYPILTKTVLALLYVYLVSYAIAFRIYQKKM